MTNLVQFYYQINLISQGENDMFCYKDRVVVVSGASSGLGAQVDTLQSNKKTSSIFVV